MQLNFILIIICILKLSYCFTFEECDSSVDGLINAAELEHCLNVISTRNRKTGSGHEENDDDEEEDYMFSESNIRQIITMLDKDNDYEINEQEYRQLREQVPSDSQTSGKQQVEVKLHDGTTRLMSYEDMEVMAKERVAGMKVDSDGLLTKEEKGQGSIDEI